MIAYANVIRAPDGSCYVNTPGWQGTVENFDWDGYRTLCSQQHVGSITQIRAITQAHVKYDRKLLDKARLRWKREELLGHRKESRA